MRTEITHEYNWGFVLSEQELRRIVQSGQEHAAKLKALEATRFIAKLKDGSLVESENLDDVLSLENGGQKAVTSLALQWDDGQEEARSSIAVQFKDGGASPRKWISVSIFVIGDSRDAVFVAAADLDERVKKTRTRAWAYLLSRPWFLMLPLFIGMFLSAVATSYFSGSISAVDQLQRDYQAGRVTNPIEAFILLERLKASSSPIRAAEMLVVSFVAPLLIFVAASFLVPKLASSYVFYWGDAIARYDRRRNVTRIFWTVVVLGILASVIGGLILRVFQ